MSIVKIKFKKFQGAGNDFVLVDNRSQSFPGGNQQQLIQRLCDRNFGIGADGLILLQLHESADFEMVYYNCDGHPSSMCGNGGRCIVAFAKQLGMIQNKACFYANQQDYCAEIKKDDIISLTMQDVLSIQIEKSFCFLDTGSPHHVVFVDSIKNIDVKSEGSSIRYGAPYGAPGTNVNFVAPIAADRFAIRTYERGVEGETLACGTGAVAAALAIYATQRSIAHSITLEALGGNLQVDFTPAGKGFTNIHLAGSAFLIFEGVYEC